MSQHLLAKSISFGAALEGAKLALGQAEKAGLFRCQQGHLKEQAPPTQSHGLQPTPPSFWLSEQVQPQAHFQVVLHWKLLGGTKVKPQRKWTMTTRNSETPKWSINPALPKGITKVFIEEIMLPVLVMATLNLIAQGLHLDASKNDPKPHPPPNQGHVASSTRVEGAEELQVSQAAKVLREKYISFLAEALPGLSHLAQSELLEDDALETTFFHGVEDGKSIPAALEVAAKCEIDRWAGPACGIGPKGLQCLFDQLG